MPTPFGPGPLRALLASALAIAGCAGAAARPRGTPPVPDALAPGAHYVAMGSSFAAGPGITAPADQPPNRCTRSADNYAHQLARRRGLTLTDVSCGGATTAHLLGPWGELPPQLDALRPDTRLVTVTIGGNDVGYIGGLSRASCLSRAGATVGACPQVPAPTEQAWQGLADAMRRVAQEVRRRSPTARLVFVEYPAVLPEQGTCARTPISVEQADASRRVAARLAMLTAQIAREAGAAVLPVAALSSGHDACSAAPWTTGWFTPGEPPVRVPYHPNLQGMTAVADALDRLLAASAAP